MNTQPVDKSIQITLAEAAERYGFNHRYLAELARKGRLEARKSGGVLVDHAGGCRGLYRQPKEAGRLPRRYLGS